MAEEKDYYKILGVERNASADEIKKAYKKLPSNGILIVTQEAKKLKKNSNRLLKHTMYYAIPTKERAMTNLELKVSTELEVSVVLAQEVWILMTSSSNLATFLEMVSADLVDLEDVHPHNRAVLKELICA